MIIAVFLFVLFCSVLAAPIPMKDGYSNPAPAVRSAPGAAVPVAGSAAAAAGGAPAAAGGAAAAGGGKAAGATKKAAVVGIVRDARVVDKAGTYSFDVAGEDGIARQESGAPLPDGGITQTGSYTYTQPDGTTFELKYIADANGFQPESSNLPALPQFVQDQIAFAKNNPEPKAASEGAKEGSKAGAKEGSKAAAASGSGKGAAAGAGAGAVVATRAAPPVPLSYNSPPAPAASGYPAPGKR